MHKTRLLHCKRSLLFFIRFLFSYIRNKVVICCWKCVSDVEDCALTIVYMYSSKRLKIEGWRILLACATCLNFKHICSCVENLCHKFQSINFCAEIGDLDIGIAEGEREWRSKSAGQQVIKKAVGKVVFLTFNCEHSACIAWCLQISVVDAFANSLGAHCRLPSSAPGLYNPLTWMWSLRNVEEEKLELVEKQVGLESIGARGTSKVLSFALVSGTIVYMHWRWHEHCSWMVEHMFSLHPFGSCLANKEITYMFILH